MIRNIILFIFIVVTAIVVLYFLMSGATDLFERAAEEFPSVPGAGDR